MTLCLPAEQFHGELIYLSADATTLGYQAIEQPYTWLHLKVVISMCLSEQAKLLQHVLQGTSTTFSAVLSWYVDRHADSKKPGSHIVH